MQLSIDMLENHRNAWDKTTKQILLCVNGEEPGDGWGRWLHLQLNGQESIQEVGSIELIGLATYSGKFTSDKNKKSNETLKYYKDAQSFDQTTIWKPDISITIDGGYGGAQLALAAMIGAEVDFLADGFEASVA